MRRNLLPVITTCLLTLCLTTSARAAVIFSDNFEADTVGSNQSLINWTVSNGTIDVVGTGFFPQLCAPPSEPSSPTPLRCVDLDGSSSDAGRITSPLLNLAPGNYSLSFFYAGNHRDTNSDLVNVSIAGFLNQNGNISPGQQWTSVSFPFLVSANASASIVFENFGGDNIGMLLDNVLLECRDCTPVPEPVSSALLGTGLVALIGLRRRASRA